MNMEELTKEYSIACAKAVRDGIHALVRKWDKDIVNSLNERDYYICANCTAIACASLVILAWTVTTGIPSGTTVI